MNNSKINFLEYLESSREPLLSDGGMGSMLHSAGISFDHCFDALNVTDPDLVLEIHQAYINAGAEIIQTNTFGANRYKLSDHDLADQVEAINRAGVEVARKAVLNSAKEIFIAGDIGPLGVRLAPYGRVKKVDAFQVFFKQIETLYSAGVDLLILETISDLNEISEGIKAARAICDLPIIASMTFTRDDRTLLGDTPEQVVEILMSRGADVMGVNCSGGPVQILRILGKMRRVAPRARFSAMPNAGFPEQIGSRIMYPASPEYFGEYTLALRSAGASVIGGCCGTTPDHIVEMRKALDNPLYKEQLISINIPFESPDMSQLIGNEVSQLSRKLEDGKFVISVEMDPPRGLSTHKLLAGASLLAESGVDVINIADSPMAQMRMSPWAVCSLVQRKINVETVLHFPTRGRNLLRVQGDLLAAHTLDIRNIFVVMGDPTSIGDFPEAMDNYDLVPSGLIRMVKCGFNLGKDHAGEEIGQPTTFFVGCALSLNPRSMEKEIRTLKRKIQAGADFALTQPVFDPKLAESFLEQYRAEHGNLEIPILAGVLPLYNLRHTQFLNNEVPGINIPQEIEDRMRKAGEKSNGEGVRIAVELAEQLRSWASGIYLMPAFGRYDLAVQIVDQINE